jgi:hypothetical protein
MKNVEERLNDLGFSIPEIQSPLANYVPAKRSGNLVFLLDKFVLWETR